MEALETLMKGLRDPSNYKAINPAYSPTTLTDSDKFLTDFQKATPDTEEGLKTYRDTTGLPTAGKTRDQVAIRIRQIGAEISEGLDDYITKYVEPTAKEIAEQRRTTIAYTFSPVKDSKIKGPKKYTAAAKTVGEAKETIQKIQEDPDAYISAQIAAAPEFMKGIVGRFPDEVCEIDANATQRTAFAAIATVGSTEFVATTHRGMTTLKEDYKTELEKIRKDGKTLTENMPPHFDAEERAKYFAQIRERETKLEETKKEFAELTNLTNTLFAEAVAAKKTPTQTP